MISKKKINDDDHSGFDIFLRLINKTAKSEFFIDDFMTCIFYHPQLSSGEYKERSIDDMVTKFTAIFPGVANILEEVWASYMLSFFKEIDTVSYINPDNTITDNDRNFLLRRITQSENHSDSLAKLLPVIKKTINNTYDKYKIIHEAFKGRIVNKTCQKDIQNFFDILNLDNEQKKERLASLSKPIIDRNNDQDLVFRLNLSDNVYLDTVENLLQEPFESL